MTELTIRNKYHLDLLEDIKQKTLSTSALYDPQVIEQIKTVAPADAIDNGEYYCSSDYLKKVLIAKDDHVGFPVEYYSLPLDRLGKHDPAFHDVQHYVKRVHPTEIGAGSNALYSYYPPKGFVGWHTNWNANAYQILFTWSKTGDGYFQYYDLKTEKVVRINDKPGWQCRHYYFGRKDEPDHHCWHSAYTNCERITIAVKFENYNLDDFRNERALQLRNIFIEEVESEE